LVLSNNTQSRDVLMVTLSPQKANSGTAPGPNKVEPHLFSIDSEHQVLILKHHIFPSRGPSTKSQLLRSKARKRGRKRFLEVESYFFIYLRQLDEVI
jgi:hypothetical protein